MIVVEAGPAPTTLAENEEEPVTRSFMRGILYVRACFGPEDRGGFRFTIDEQGHADGARDSTGGSLPDPLATCVRAALAHARFPRPRSGPVIVRVPLAMTGELHMELVPCD